MKTDRLIAVLAADAKAERPLATGLWVGLVPAVALSSAGLLAGLGPRPDLAAAVTDPVAGLRHVLSLTLMLAGLAVAMRLARPGERPGRTAFWFVVVAGLAGTLWLSTFVGTPPGMRAMAVQGKTMTTCLATIPVLSLLPVAAVLVMLRRGVVERPALGGAVAGLAGGGAGAAIYALHCIEDNPLFFVTWYGLAILIVTGLSALVGARVLRR
ncbi:MAG: NrsF family protein [Pseudorhodobacter sp.]